MNAQDFYLNKGKPIKEGAKGVIITAGQTMGQFAKEWQDIAEKANPEEKEKLLKMLDEHLDAYYNPSKYE